MRLLAAAIVVLSAAAITLIAWPGACLWAVTP